VRLVVHLVILSVFQVTYSFRAGLAPFLTGLVLLRRKYSRQSHEQIVCCSPYLLLFPDTLNSMPLMGPAS